MPIQAGIFIFTGLACFAISVFAKTAHKKLSQSGLSAEGIIYKLELDNGSSRANGFSGKLKDKITVRFLTRENVWVTGEAKSQFLIFFTGQYKEGDLVRVKYNPDQPAEFILESRQSETAGRVIGVVAGLILVVSGIYQWIHHNL